MTLVAGLKCNGCSKIIETNFNNGDAIAVLPDGWAEVMLFDHKKHFCEACRQSGTLNWSIRVLELEVRE